MLYCRTQDQSSSSVFLTCHPDLKIRHGVNRGFQLRIEVSLKEIHAPESFKNKVERWLETTSKIRATHR